MRKNKKMPMYNKRKIYYSDMTKGLEAIESRVFCNNRFHYEEQFVANISNEFWVQPDI
ncbi:MAG: hypothetical protein KDC31_08325 [Saprospiraceae bacterium]|nr:hypothetical protein [Saprospiraceae bacterium]MBX7180001.1 hypothetical protein [Saprospiraceae bacterium]MCB0591283.1 hypothetical protein [Saprospiraceae bacterium]MCO5283544.1 hypothetical protein [Saprospiraceae bacterium]MCO6470362.1 hypothetical protein [Saprospiraceae bacterium]